MDLAGMLLVAMPVVSDPFDRAVILLLAHDATGALGIVLNQPSTTDVGGPLPRWDDLAAEPAVVFVGGPVEQEAAIALGRDEDGYRQVDLETDPALLTVHAVRVFAGYAGWSPGQLEDELAQGAWAVVDAEPDDAFRADAESLWYAVLRRQGGQLARLAMLPEDLSVN